MIRLFRTALRARSRALFAISGNGLVSVASLALSVAVARTNSIEEFGEFALALVAYTFAAGLVRASCTDTALARPADMEAFRRSFRRSALVGVILSTVLLIWGAVTGNIYLIIVGLSLHGQLALDFIRTYESAVGSAGRAMAYSASWSLLSILASAISFFWSVPAWALMLCWAASGALAGYVAMMASHAPWLPGWPREHTETSAAALFSLDYVVGSGGSALTTLATGVFVDKSVVGALRGAGTLLGPVNLVASTARSLVIPRLATERARSASAEFPLATRITAILVGLIFPLLVALQFLPESWGTTLLGDTWTVASIVLAPLAVESLFALIGSIPAAGHRAAFAGARALTLRLAVGVPRPFVVVFFALVGGASGAAWAMAGISIVNAVIWWLSYYSLVRRAPKG